MQIKQTTKNSRNGKFRNLGSVLVLPQVVGGMNKGPSTREPDLSFTYTSGLIIIITCNILQVFLQLFC